MLLLDGKPASTAYEEAGYVPNDGNAIRLKGNERVKARLTELQEQVAKKSEVTVASLLDELESWFRKSAQDDKWSFRLTVGTLCPTN